MLSSYRVESTGEQAAEAKRAPKALALEKAGQFLQHVLGDDWQHYRETGSSFVLIYTRFHNELPVLEDKVRVTVDRNGRVRNYVKQVASPDLTAFPDPAGAVSKQMAEAELTREMKLRYIEYAVLKRDPETHEAVEVGPLLEYTPAVSFMEGESLALVYRCCNRKDAIRAGEQRNGVRLSHARADFAPCAKRTRYDQVK